MSVSRETESLVLNVQAQLEERAAGKRKNIHHGGTLCCGCHQVPPVRNGKYCKPCRNAYDARRRLKFRIARDSKKMSEGKIDG